MIKKTEISQVVVNVRVFRTTAVSLMVKRTLKKQKFLCVMSCRPVAVEHLVTYMTTRHELSAVIDLLVALGRFHDSGVVAYRQAVASSSPEYRVRYLPYLPYILFQI